MLEALCSEGPSELKVVFQAADALCASLRGSKTLQSCPNYSSERRISQTLRLLRTPSQACFWSSDFPFQPLCFKRILYMTE
ncbi:hypothetical protein NQZ68_031282 [Dissostichus eleginoides]|nr:hypothetical protein NQZ68_031282 [Dissostichus eleginoides]